MPFYEQGDVRINYELIGAGPPVLLIAPGGMRSAFELWANMPWNPLEALADSFQLVAMDQRNAGDSWAPIAPADSWDVYTADQLGLLDHLGIDQFSVVGMCIGGPYVMGLIKAAPTRVQRAVMLQPIGLDDNREAFYEMFDGWAGEVAPAHPEADATTLASFRSHMYDGDFMFNATREDVAACPVPLLVMMGDDLYHPQSVSRDIASIAPDVLFVEQWKEPSVLDETNRTIREFLAGLR